MKDLKEFAIGFAVAILCFIALNIFQNKTDIVTPISEPDSVLVSLTIPIYVKNSPDYIIFRKFPIEQAKLMKPDDNIIIMLDSVETVVTVANTPFTK